ncbi:CAAX amino terminal membrane bound protease [Spiroplasma sabaudiense Ar-1343]|uniref:CAAX amino terminal membrane bound protease n=1 Tax=Spiroplasma sabaudiense Ar-1343 TaxID=1276257 RepID=W6AIH7_9MOLU|nr:CPBP family intramembrane glutamic endopeptidase [Spiroplasma sabaudiense]AHI53509.1 CAAX amino terminal membrane bound protease [Spiroplasma sabaudiense Ar-1343]
MNNLYPNNNLTDEEVIKPKNKKRGWEAIEIPSRLVNVNYPFDFKTYTKKSVGIIFLFTGLIIPLTIGLILKYVFSPESDFNSSLTLINWLFYVISNGIGFFIIWDKRRSKIFKTTLSLFYLYILMPIIVSIIAAVFAMVPNVNSNIQFSIQIILQSIFYGFMIFLTFNYIPDFKARFSITLKQNWKMFLVVILVGFLAILILSIAYNQILKAIGWNLGNSNNQESLISPLKDPNIGVRIFAAISLFVFTVIAAPLLEEIVFRDAVFVGTSNRWTGWIMSMFLFAYVHIYQTGEFQSIFQYLIGGFVLATAFNVCRGNLVYTWGIHAAYNLFSFILIVIEASQ